MTCSIGTKYMQRNVRSVISPISIHVEGEPIPMGSKIAGVTKDGKPYLRDSNSKNLRAWQKAVYDAADAVAGAAELKGAIEVNLFFRLRAPKTLVRSQPCVKPDLDKLVRSTLDPLTKCAVWGDDAQVCSMNVSKTYASPGKPPGVTIIVRPA